VRNAFTRIFQEAPRLPAERVLAARVERPQPGAVGHGLSHAWGERSRGVMIEVDGRHILKRRETHARGKCGAPAPAFTATRERGELADNFRVSRTILSNQNRAFRVDVAATLT
jgi:hypothetical protein